MNPHPFCVVELDTAGRFLATVSGCGRNRGTWDSEAHSRRTAQRWAAGLRRQYPSRRFAVVPSLGLA